MIIYLKEAGFVQLFNKAKIMEKMINIALFDDKYFTVFATENFQHILDGYRWEVNGKRYLFRTERIYDKDILLCESSAQY